MRFLLGLPALFALCASVALALGCSSKQGDATSPDPTGSAEGSNTNPYGVPYPTKHYGRRPRGMGQGGQPNEAHGDVMPNLKFMGYPDGDTSKPMQPVALADYFDPQGLKYTVIHIMYSDGWCVDCIEELATLTKALNDPKTDYRRRGVVYLEAVGEGVAQGTPATKVDLDAWVKGHPKLFAEVLDPAAAKLGAFFDTSIVPFNANLDPRSMEILSSTTGYEDPSSVLPWVDWATSSPPMDP